MLGGCFGSYGTGGRPGLTAQEAENQHREAEAADFLDKAMQLYHDGEYLEEEAALSYLDEAIKLDPTLVTALYQRAILLLELGRDVDALKDTTALLKSTRTTSVAALAMPLSNTAARITLLQCATSPSYYSWTTPFLKHLRCAALPMRK